MIALKLAETLRRPTREELERAPCRGSRRHEIALMRKRGQSIPIRWVERWTGTVLAEQSDGTGLT